MKRLATILLLAGLIPASSSGQFLRGWGIKGGVVAAHQAFYYTPGSTSPGIPRSPRWGVYAGLFAEFLNVPVVSIALEGAYEQKGRKVSAEEVTRSSAEPAYLSPGPAGSTLQLDYFSLALVIKARAGRRGLVPYAGIGPRFDFVLSRDKVELYRNFKRSDIGIIIAGGFEIIPRRHPALSFEARWSPSFSRAFSNDILIVKNQTIDLLCAVWF